MYDLHAHTYYSDGTDSPRKLIEAAKAAGLQLIGITDHDSAAGVPEARAAAAELGVPLLCGAEIEAEYPSKLHILGLGMDCGAKCLTDMLAVQERRRVERNEAMLKKLYSAGMDIYPYYRTGRGVTTRTHIALALVEAGYAESAGDAFTRLIGRDSPLFVSCEHPTMRETVECITRAGGKAVLAHPHKMRCDHEALVRELADCGLWGVEAFYPGSDEETVRYFKILAIAYGLRVTCGSDYHGANRPKARLGCSWRPVPDLEDTYYELKELAV